MIRVDRLRALSKHLKEGQLGHAEFSFLHFNAVRTDASVILSTSTNVCGTVGCAVGELPVLYPDDWQFGLDGMPKLTEGHYSGPFSCAVAFFGISHGACNHLFSPYNQQTYLFGGKKLSAIATKEEVADNIDTFCDLVEAGRITRET